MDAQQILQAWREDSSKLADVKLRVGWVEITLPFSTITDTFVRVFVRHQESIDNYILSDCGDLEDNEYEVADQGYPAQGLLACARALLGAGHFDTIKEEGGHFFCRVKKPELLTSAICNMAQFIQLAVNMAAMAN